MSGSADGYWSVVSSLRPGTRAASESRRCDEEEISRLAVHRAHATAEFGKTVQLQIRKASEEGSWSCAKRYRLNEEQEPVDMSGWQWGEEADIRIINLIRCRVGRDCPIKAHHGLWCALASCEMLYSGLVALRHPY